MPPSISLQGLSWRRPDGAFLFRDLELAFGPGRTGIVGRNGTGKTTLLRLIAGHLTPTAGQVRVAAHVAMMRQDGIGQAAETVADLFGARKALDALARAGAGLADKDDLSEADWTLPFRVEDALARCGLSVPPSTAMAALSGGQRNRAALAAVLFADPDFLLLDEPTNDMDAQGRKLVSDIVRGWRKGVVLVSHDRALLEAMDAIVDLSALGATLHGGNYSRFRQSKDRALQNAERALAHAEKTASEAARQTQQAIERKARKDSAGQRARAKGDQPKILMDAARNRAEASGGASARLHEARRQAMAEQVSAARRLLEVIQPLRMDIASTALPSSRTVLQLDRVSFGHDAASLTIDDMSLTVTGPERIVITGPNGSGKTTLLRLVAGKIKPQRGRVRTFVPSAFLDQDVGLIDRNRSLRDNFLRLNPASNVQAAHAALARFGFRAADGLRLGGGLSGGERLRAGLACVLGADPPPMLLVLDEPTNHLDLDGLAALEGALAAYDGAILAVSHDSAFDDALRPDRTIDLGQGKRT